LTRFLFHFINTVMAIRRCPYCKAIVDGVAEYCSNCGTQLLFPEDESKEEEIPGDEIVEEEEEILEEEEAESEKEELPPESEEKKEEKKEGKGEETLKAKEEKLEKEEPSPEGEKTEEGKEEEEKELEEEEENEEIKKELEEALTPPKIEDTDIEDPEARKMQEAREMVKKETEKLWASVGTGEEGSSLDVDIEFQVPHEEEKEEIYVTSPPQREEIDLQSIRLRRTPDTEKREKEEIDKFVESVREERGKDVQPAEEDIPPSAKIEMEEKEEKEFTPPSEREEIDLQSIEMGKTPDSEEMEKVEIESFVESIKREREKEKDYFTPEEEVIAPKEMGEETSEIKEKIPPWAEKIKEDPPQELENEEKEKEKEEPEELEEDFKDKEIKTPVDEPLPKEDKPPTPTPGTLSKTDEPILLDKEIGFPEKVDYKVPFDREIREKKRAVRRRRSRYYAWLKARAFDFVFIAAFSLICLGLASRLIQVSLFKLILTSGPPVLVFYFVLLLFYFGFFILFLGETPGDRLFPRD
jgi:hypothetical protein